MEPMRLRSHLSLVFTMSDPVCYCLYRAVAERFDPTVFCDEQLILQLRQSAL
jgi:hypothetical protein